MAPRVLETADIEGDPEVFENKNVHTIYDEIATHFSSTRYKPWPIIASFLSKLPTGWVGLDSGTGNGKYLSLPPDRPGDILTIGLDRSRNLLNFARSPEAGVFREVVLGNVLDNLWRPGIFDYAISIATVHHLATHERRRSAVKQLLLAVSPHHGRVLIYVWAIEQDELSKRKVLADERPPPTSGMDVVVPWVLSRELTRSQSDAQDQMVYNRYYHMFAKGELATLVKEVANELSLVVGKKGIVRGGNIRGIEIVQDGWEKSNYYVELHLWRSE